MTDWSREWWADQESPLDTEPFRAIERVAARETPVPPVMPVVSPASTDSRFLRPRGVVCYGFTPFVLTRAELTGIHGVNELVSLDNLREGSCRMFAVVRELCTSNG